MSWSSQQQRSSKAVGKARTLMRRDALALFRRHPLSNPLKLQRAIHGPWWPALLTLRSSSLRPAAFAGRSNRCALCPPLNANVEAVEKVRELLRS